MTNADSLADSLVDRAAPHRKATVWRIAGFIAARARVLVTNRRLGTGDAGEFTLEGQSSGGRFFVRGALRSRMLTNALTLAVSCSAWLSAAPLASAADPSALWTIVHGACVTDELTFGHAAPCSAVDLAAGYAVLKDISGASQYLLIPTDRVTGIESAKLLRPSSPNYFQQAWGARKYVEDSLGQKLPREDVALAINSYYGRSQNQLHIHIDCVKVDVRRSLDAEQNQLGPRWSTMKILLAGHRYRAMRLASADFATVDPFKLLARTDPTAQTNMGRETLVAIGATFGGHPGFYLLSDRAAILPLDHGSGEELLDHSCKIAPSAAGKIAPSAAGKIAR